MLQKNCMGNRRNVVIIGAGIAGLSAAKTLFEGGIEDILILEAQSIPGGRVRSLPVEGGYIDLGAQWLHGSESFLCSLADEANLLSPLISEEGVGLYYRENGEVIDPKLVAEIAKVFDEILDSIQSEKGEQSQSVGDYLEKEFDFYLNSCSDSPHVKQIKKELYDWHIRFQIIDNCCDNLLKLSYTAWEDYNNYGGQKLVNFKGGCISLINLLLRDLPSSALHLNCPVLQVRWSETMDDLSSAPCTIMCKDGTIYKANHVIVTPSVGFLRETPGFFKPSLPQRYEKWFNLLGFDVINKVFLIYDKPWWTKETKGFQLLWSDKGESHETEESWTRGLTGFDVLVNLPGVLVGWVGGEAGRLVENFSPDVIGQHCTNLFKKITSRTDIPSPVKVYRSEWGKDPYVRGGYSFIKSNVEGIGADIKKPLQPVYTNLTQFQIEHPAVIFAGEAHHTTRYSTLHGAYESGFDQANLLLQYIKEESKINNTA